MKIKIVEPGWVNFTGHLGAFHFTDNVSDEDIGTADAAFLAGIVSIEVVGTGANPSSAQTIIDNANTEAEIEQPVKYVPVAPVEGAPVYTKEALEAIADASGIKGIREVAEPLGISGTSIVGIIEKILLVQADGRELAK